MVLATARPSSSSRRARKMAFSVGNLTHTVPSEFASFTIDTGSLLGNLWHSNSTFPFSNGYVRTLTSALSPAILRVGGTAADRCFYDVAPDSRKRFGSYGQALNATELVSLFDFARDLNLQVAFGLNGGKGPRAAHDGNAWDAANAQQLITWVKRHCPSVQMTWELGNEPNLYLVQGNDWSLRVSGKQLAADFATLRGIVGPETRVVGVDIATQLVDREAPLAPVIDGFLQAGGGQHIDALTYHYYPLLGQGTPIKAILANPTIDPLYATAERAVSKRTFERSANVMTRMLAQQHQIGRSGNNSTSSTVWLGEAALACFGGRTNVSDAWAGTFHHLYTLGQAASLGLQLYARQDLVGAGYGLIDGTTFQPRPDYWALVLWKRFMGNRVLNTTLMQQLVADGSDDDEAAPAGLRAYAHCVPGRQDAQQASLLLINAAPTLRNVPLGSTTLPIEKATRVYLAEAGGDGGAPLEDASGKVRLGGRLLEPMATGEPPSLSAFGRPLTNGSVVELGAWSYAFVSPVRVAACA